MRTSPMLRAALAVATVVSVVVVTSVWTASPNSAIAASPRQSLDLLPLVREANLGPHVALMVVDLQTGEPLFSHNVDLPLNPASNMKLVTAALALSRLGPSHRMLTGLYGDVQPGGAIPALAIRGFGDPTLKEGDFLAMAAALADQGVRRVEEIVVDGSYFDDRVLPPAFEQQPNEMSAFRAPIAAVSVNENAYTLRVSPGDHPGEPARVRTDAKNYFAIENGLTTTPSGEPNVVAIQHALGDRLQVKLRGNVPSTVRAIVYRRRVESPLSYAGFALAEALRNAGIRVAPKVTLGPVPENAALLVSHESPQLAQIVAALGKDSDNFVAEMLLKVVAAERRRPGRSEDGAAAAQQFIDHLKKKVPGTRVVNGSGLFDGNKVSVSQLIAVLAHMYAEPALRAEYVAHLAVGGIDGTLANRLKRLPAPRILRAKTGTLDDVIALSGYVFGKRPEKAWAFSFIANHVRGKQAVARTCADTVAERIAAKLWR